MATAPFPTSWLLVDDDEVFIEVLARRIRNLGDDVVCSLNGEEVIALARAQQPDRVVLDLKIGQVSGISLLPELRTLLPNAQILVLTGFASIATAVRAIKEGADNYLPKPVAFQELLRAFNANDDISELAATSDTMSPQQIAREHIERVVEDEHGNISAAARRLNMHRRSLQRILQKKARGS